jgi:hypothetical protein
MASHDECNNGTKEQASSQPQSWVHEVPDSKNGTRKKDVRPFLPTHSGGEALLSGSSREKPAR